MEEIGDKVATSSACKNLAVMQLVYLKKCVTLELGSGTSATNVWTTGRAELGEPSVLRT